jgi:guanosine-3',5'-bis(diphosphate) 3'-pyrophosphohydrolase
MRDVDGSLSKTYLPLLSAASFAARAHKHQIRKDGITPYDAHPFRVCLIVRHVFGIADPELLTAALLHDTIEDTTTDRDDLIERFGPRVAEWVAALSKDKRLPDEARETAYMQTLADAAAPVKLCKLADIFDNLLDSGTLCAEQRRRTIGRAQSYLAKLKTNLPHNVRTAFGLVEQLLAETEAVQGARDR